MSARSRLAQLPNHTIHLAPGVHYRDHLVHDNVRGRSWPVNGNAAAVLAILPATLPRVVDTLQAPGMPRRMAEDRAITFLGTMNRRYLVNCRRTPRSWCHETARRSLATLSSGTYIPAFMACHRSAVDTCTLTRTLFSATRAVVPSGLRVALLAGVVLTLVFALLGARDVTTILALSATLGIGMVLHEVGHVLPLRHKPAAVTRRGLRPAVLHGALPTGRSVWVTAAGPLTGVVCGAVLLAPAAYFHLSSIALAAIVTATQAAGFTCLSADGRKLCIPASALGS